jgi:hypothetical protein
MSTLSSFSSPSSSRRSNRISSRPSRYDEEQVSFQLQQHEDKDIQRAIQLSVELDVDDSTDEDSPPADTNSEVEEEEKQQAIVQQEREWTTAIHNIAPRPFSTPFGPTGVRRSHTSPLRFFQLFLFRSLIQHIANCTNEYANSKNAVDWTPTNTSELYSFIGLLIYMGIDQLPQLPMYWSSLYSHSFVTSVISRNRFQQLLRYFYVSSQVEQQHNTDRLKKVRWFSQQLQQQFSSHYIPSQELTVDEAMVGFKGRSELKQYIPQKPTKWGYKIWCLADCNYLLRFEIYEGKSSSSSTACPSDVVLSLTSPYQYRNHIVYLDRYFTSPTLLDELLERGTSSCGTVRKDRVGLPPTFKTVANGLAMGEMRCWQRDELGALVWKDRRAVYLLTTHKSPIETTFVSRSGSSEQTAVPTAILDYNKSKGGVDTIDQMRESYAIGRKGKKWWPQLVWWLIDMCILNAYSLYNQQQQVKISQLEFRERLMQQLIEHYPQQRSRIGRPPSTPPINVQRLHYPSLSDVERDCFYCSERPDHRKQTQYRCDLCDVYVCAAPCFQLFHTKH